MAYIIEPGTEYIVAHVPSGCLYAVTRYPDDERLHWSDELSSDEAEIPFGSYEYDFLTGPESTDNWPDGPWPYAIIRSSSSEVRNA